jgi:hypothetical protein
MPRQSLSDSQKEEAETRRVQDTLEADEEAIRELQDAADDRWKYALASFIVRSRPSREHRQLAIHALYELATGCMHEEIDDLISHRQVLLLGQEDTLASLRFAHGCRRAFIRTITFRGGPLPKENPGKVKARWEKLGVKRRKLATKVDALIKAFAKDPEFQRTTVSSLTSANEDPQSTTLQSLFETLAERLRQNTLFEKPDFTPLSSELRPFDIPQPGRTDAQRTMFERALNHQFLSATGKPCDDLVSRIWDDVWNKDGGDSATPAKAVAARRRANSKR